MDTGQCLFYVYILCFIDFELVLLHEQCESGYEKCLVTITYIYVAIKCYYPLQFWLRIITCNVCSHFYALGLEINWFEDKMGHYAPP